MKKIKIKGPVLCIVCGKELKSIHGEDYDMIHSGIKGHLYAPYGSSHDGDIYQIAICDDCIQQKEKEDKVVLLGNYIFGDTINHRGETAKVEYDD